MKRPTAMGLLVLGFVAQSIYFGGLTFAAFLDLRGQRAYFRNDLVGAWDLTRRAAAAGGDSDRLEEFRIAILLMGFNQRDVGVQIDVPLEGEEGVAEARRLLGRRLADAPHRAAFWSYAADLSFHRAQVIRRSRPIDLSALSENPMENLLPEDRLGLAALEKAAAVEPNNYLYNELLAEQFLEYGAEAEAENACRQAVAAYPRLEGHTYLGRFDLPGPVVDAALRGFEDALRSTSLVARVEILRDAARLLMRHNRDEEAIPYLVDATRIDPQYYDARIDLAMTRLRLGRYDEARPDLEAAALLVPEDPLPHFYLGRIRHKAGDHEGAIGELRQARVLGASETKVFLEMAEAFEALGRLKEAGNQLTAATYLHPQDTSAWSALYTFAMRHGDARVAARACERLATLSDVDERLLRLCAAPKSGGA